MVRRLNGPTTYSVAFIVEPVATTNEPVITLVAPSGATAWEVGTTQYIKWTTQNVDDVRIYYSIDGGETFEEITNTVGLEEPHWGNLPWTVPDVPVENCVVRILGYFGEDPTNSASFAIVSEDAVSPPPGGSGDQGGTPPSGNNTGSGLEQTADGLTVSGGCSVPPLRGNHPAGVAWWLILPALWLSRQRRQPMR